MPIYLFLFLLIFIINTIPAFMPPTWIVLSFFYIHFHLLFLPTVLLGVVAATSGRIVLALLARHIFSKVFPKKMLKNYKGLGRALKKRQKLTIPIVFAYAFSPISSNTLFIILGLSHTDLDLVAFSFFIGRLISYSFWVSATYQVSKRLSDVFNVSFTKSQTIISFIITLLVIIIVGAINWEKILLKKKK